MLLMPAMRRAGERVNVVNVPLLGPEPGYTTLNTRFTVGRQFSAV